MGHRFWRARRAFGLVAAAAAVAVPAAFAGDSDGAATTGGPLAAAAAPETAAAASGQSSEIYLVELEDGPSVFRKQAKAVGLKYTERFAYKRLFNGVAVRIDAGDVGKLAGIGSVANVYPAGIYTLGPVTAADPELATAIQMTGADVAQAAGFTGAGVKVAVMDTGVDVDHQDLGGDGTQAAPHPFPNARIVAGVDLVGDDYNADPESSAYQPVPHPDALPDDCNGHGTHVAGIVGANGAGAAAAKGVAPGVTFGAYRVFGCGGSTTDDVMIAAMEAALADGMHILNMSIGDAFNNWPGSPTAAASDALVDAGMVVVASIGNSGTDGIYSAGAPGVGDKVIGTASYDNTHVQQIVFKVSPDDLGIPFGVAAAAPPPPTSGTMPLAKTGTPTTPADGCAATDFAAVPAGSAVLVRRGSCTFHQKSLNAQNAGAAAVVLYNNVAGAFSPTVAGSPAITIPVVAITAANGIVLDNRIAAGPTTLTWTTERGTFPNPTGGLISSFSSYGTAATLQLKPDIGAPGGLIRSTYPLEAGGYATISGTSMSSPHVAGAAALLKQARPLLAAERFRDVLQNTADARPWSGAPTAGLLDIVHRQGAGMLDIDDAIRSTTTILPGKLSLGEGTGGSATLTLSNTGAAPVTYALSDVVAVSTGAQTFAPLVSDFWLPETTVTFGAPNVTVPAGGTATVNVSIAADPLEPAAPDFLGFPTRGLYGGYLVFTNTTNAADVYRVPYVGFKGDYQSIVAMPNAPVVGKQNAPFSKGPQTYVAAAANEVWTLASPDEVPNVLVHLDHQVRRLELQVVDAASGAPVHPVFSKVVERNFVGRNATRPPAGGPYAADENVFAFPWDGTRMHDNGKGTPDHRKVVPDGQYKIVARALKALGDPANPAHWEIQTSPTITIDRP